MLQGIDDDVDDMKVALVRILNYQEPKNIVLQKYN